MKKGGFTLIELMVVVSIIAILSTIGLVGYQVVTKNARDAKRQSDLKAIQSALEQYHADQFYYPFPAGASGWSSTNGCNANYENAGWFTVTCALKSPPNGSKTYLNKIPNDPLCSDYLCSGNTTIKRYLYTVPSGCNNTSIPCKSYCLYAQLENPPSPPPPSGCSYPTGYNFAVTLP